MSNKYFITKDGQKIDIENIVAPAVNFLPAISTGDYYTPTISGVAHTSKNSWEDYFSLGNTYLINGNEITFATINSCPTFKNNIYESEYSFNIKLATVDGEDALQIGSKKYKASDAVFNGGGIPDRLLVILQAGGGGGGGTSNVWAAAWCIGGANGAGGGGGACCAVILNIAKLKAADNSYYNITIGLGGAGSERDPGSALAVLLAGGNGTNHSTDAGKGGDSIIYYKAPGGISKTLITAGGGQPGGRAKAYDGGGSGAGGTVTFGEGENDFWWKVPYTDSIDNISLKNSSGGNGGQGGNSGSNGGQGGSVAACALIATYASDFINKSANYCPFSSKSGGNAGQSKSGGGGASLFGNGGAGGGATEWGKNGGTGAGGGGGRYTYGGIANDTSVNYSIKGGGNGGKGHCYIYF